MFSLHRVICWTTINIPLLNSSNTPYCPAVALCFVPGHLHFIFACRIPSTMSIFPKILLKCSISGSCSLLLTPRFLCLLHWSIPVAYVAQVAHCPLSFPNTWALTCESLGVTSLCDSSKFSNKKVQIYQQHFLYSFVLIC